MMPRNLAMSWYSVSAILLLVFTQSVLSQGTGTFTIGGQTYPSQGQQYNALYVYDRSRGSPAPFNFTCTSTQGGILEVRTNIELLSGSLPGPTVVNNVTITGTSTSLTFDPEFLPQFSGVYTCDGDGIDVQEDLRITTENPFLRVNMNVMRPVTVVGSVDMFNITILSAYTASGGVSQRATREDYSLEFFLDGERFAVQDLVIGMETTPYEQVFLVDVGRSFQNGTDFNLTLSVSGLTTSVIFPVIVQDLPQLPDKIILQEGSTLSIDCAPTSMGTLEWSRDGVILQTTSPVFVVEGATDSNSGTYTCTAFGITRQVPVYIIPAISNGVAIQYNSSFVPDQYVINDFNGAFTLICVGTQGNGELTWFAERSQAVESNLANTRGQAGNFSGSFAVEGVEITVVYSRNEARLTVSMVMPSYNETFKCYSGESGERSRVVTTTDDPYLQVLSPGDAVIGQMVTFSYTVATSFTSFTLEHTFNEFVIPNPVPSPDNAQLRQYSFIANSSSGGMYSLFLSGTGRNGPIRLTVDFDLEIIVPTLAAQPTVVYVRNGDMVTLNCTPSDLRAPVTWFQGPSTQDPVIEHGAVYRFNDPTLRHSLSFAVRLPEWDEGGELPPGLNPPPASLGLRQIPPVVANAVTDPQLWYTCGLTDGQTVVNEQTIAFNTLRGPVQNIYRSPSRTIFLYNDAVIFIATGALSSFSLRCVTLDGHENPRWSTDNIALAELLSAQQTNTVQIGATNVTLRVLNSREQELLFTSEIMPDLQLAGNYSCVSQTSRQSSNVTLTTGDYVRCTNGTSVTAPLGSATLLEFQVAGFSSDGAGSSTLLLPLFEGNFTALSVAAASQPNAGYGALYHTHPNGVVFYFGVVDAQDAGEYRLSHTISSGVTAAVSLNVNTSITLTAPVTSVNVRERQNVNFFCTPSDSRVQLQWEFFGLGSSNPSTLFTPPRPGPIPPPDLFRRIFFDSSGQTVRLTDALPFDAGVYRCSVAGDTGMLVPPVNISVTVIRRCVRSYAAGEIWGPAFEGDIVRFPCSRASSRFSSVVTMSRECRTTGQWSSVDFSSCTLQSATEPPFLLIWLHLDEFPVVSSTDQFATEISAGVFSSGGIQVSDPVVQILPQFVLLTSSGFGSISVVQSFPLLYSATISESDIAGVNISAVRNYLNGLESLQGISVSNSEREVAGFQKSDNCECRRHGFTLVTELGSILIGDRVDRVQELCAETVSSPCNCSIASCVCTSPYVGNGVYCSLDRDGDRFPEVAVRNCTESERQRSVNYCVMDSCPRVFNLPNNDTTPCNPTSAEVCPREVDTEYGLEWGYTAPGITLLRSCGANYTGNATRFCQSDATWAPPDVSQCDNVAFATLRTIAEGIYTGEIVVDDATLSAALGVVDELFTFTEPTSISIFPRDLNTSNFIITNTVDFLFSTLEVDLGGVTDITVSAEVVGVIDNLLDQVNLAGFEDLQAVEPGSQSVLNNAERYALYLATAMSQNTSEGGVLMSRGNIVVRSERIAVTTGSDVTFPQQGDLDNFTISSGMPAVINIPAQLIVERSNSSSVPVAHTLFQNLQDFLPPELNNSTAAPVSLIISSQVAVQSGLNVVSHPVTITFIVEGATDGRFSCVFWNFSDPIGSGGWSREGVTTVQVTQDGNNTVVQCNSTHLTSFAVLVNVAGTSVDSLALSIVSYIGLGISLACLLLTIIFFLLLGKKLFKEVHNFVHLNLAIALFLGYLTFAVGVELARTNKAACQAVTAIMQYFFLASFCWMLCEGIMLYLMLVLVFSRLSKKWWFFFLLGWTPPIIFVVIGLTTVLDEYVVYSRNSTGGILTDAAGNDIISFCWLSSGFGTNAIWTFVAPMLAIVLINSVFLILVLVSVFRNRGHRMSEMKEKGKRIDLVVTMVKASLILLPLLGLTWVLGLFAVNQNTLVFAWLFTIFNSLQGAFIFFFHVLRSERVWGRIKKKYSVYSSTHSKSGDKGTASTSGGKKTSGVTNSSGGESTLEMKEKTGASLAYTTHFEPNDDTIKKPITDDEVAAVMISEATINAERPAEEEVKNKSDLTSDEPTSDAVETTAAEAVLTGYKESMEEEVGFSGEKEYALVEVDEEEELVVKEGGGHIGEVGVNQQPHLLKMRKDDVGATVRREFHTELLLRRNEELRKRMESILGVSLSEDTAEPIRDDILLCRLMNKLHPGMIHEETSAEKRIHNVAEFITACKKLKIPEHKLCTAGDIMEGKNMDSVIACLEYLLESSSL